MSSFTDEELFGRLFVGDGQPEALGRHVNQIRGASYIQGPIQFGNDKAFHPEIPPPLTVPIPKPEGVLMVGPLKNPDSPLPFVCDPLFFCGEELKNPYSLVVKCGDHITQDTVCGVGNVPIEVEDVETSLTPAAGREELIQQNLEKAKETPNVTAENYIVTPSIGAALFLGDVDIYGETRVKNNLVTDEEVMSNCGAHVLSAKKNFDIPHPTKEGWRLTHTCVEGPEAAVYVRGRVRNKTEINLPEYWKGLVDIDTITINLTPIGAHQDIIVKRWDDEKVYLQAKGGMPINCFYYIMAERADTEKLIPEYEGTIEDYPGDNSQRSIAGYHYDTKENN